MNESPLEIPVVTKDVHPDTAAVKVGRLVAGAAIDDHFLDTVLPTLAAAINNQRHRVLVAADKWIKEKLDGDLRPIVEPLLKKIVQEAIAKHGDGNGLLTIELYDPANERTEYMSRQHFMFPFSCASCA